MDRAIARCPWRPMVLQYPSPVRFIQRSRAAVRSGLVVRAAAGLLGLGCVGRAVADEHPVNTDLTSTTLSGYVDTSAVWGTGPIGNSWPAVPGGETFLQRTLVNQSPAILHGTVDSGVVPEVAPMVSPLSVGRPRWWTWVAPDQGTYVLDAGPNPHAALAVFAGTEVEHLSSQAQNTTAITRACSLGLVGSNGWRLQRFVTVDVEAGQVLQIAADYAVANEDLGDLSGVEVGVPPGAELNVVAYFIPVPAEDGFARRKSLTGSAFTGLGTTFAARSEMGEPNPNQRTVWYRWIAPQSGLATLSTQALSAPAGPQAVMVQSNLPPARYDWPEGIAAGRELWLMPTNSVPGAGSPWGSVGVSVTGVSVIRNGATGFRILDCAQWVEVDPAPAFQPVFSVFTGDSLTALQMLGRGTNFSFRVEAGVEYSIQLASDRRAMGAQEFHLLIVTPPNDSWSGRQPLVGSIVAGSGYTTGAGAEPGEPAGLGHSTWWTWIAPESGEARWLVSTGDFSPRVAVFRGAALVDLSPVAEGGASVGWVAEAGTTYTLAVASADAREGSYNFDLSLARFAPAIVSRDARTVVDGSFRLGLGHLYGRSVTLWASADLSSWQPLWTGRFNADDGVIRDFSTGPEPRFYRLTLTGAE